MSDLQEASLKKLTSPEQLHERLKVVGIRSWVSLIVVGLIVVIIIFWAFLGSIPIIVQGQGIVFDQTVTINSHSGNISSSTSQNQKIYAVFPFESGEKIKDGMPVQVELASVETDKYGALLGRVVKVFPYLTSFEHGSSEPVFIQELLEYLNMGKKAGVIVEIEPETNPNTPTGYQWSFKEGPPFKIQEGTFSKVVIVLQIRKPISFLKGH